jgi:hypothetical protein
MTPEQQVRQRIVEQETKLALQELELKGLYQSALKSLHWKSLLTQSLIAVVQFKPLQELVLTSTLRFAAFKLGKTLLQKLGKLRRPKKTSE